MATACGESGPTQGQPPAPTGKDKAAAASGPTAEAAPQDPATAPPTADPSAVSYESSNKESGFVVIKQDTPLFIDTKGTPAPVLTPNGKKAEPAVIGGSPSGYVMRVEARDGEWLQLSNTSAKPVDQPLCGRDLLALEGLSVRLWAREDSLFPVTTKETSMSFDDGTSVRMVPGVPIVKIGGLHYAETWGQRVRLGEAPEGVGTVFESRKPLSGEADATRQKLKSPIAVNGMGLFMLSVLMDKEGTKVFGRNAKGMPLLRTPCLELGVEQEAANADPSEGSLFGGGGGFGGGKLRFTAEEVAEGGELLWPDGSPAGVALEHTTLLGASLPGSGAAKGSRCYTRKVGAAGGSLQLCPAPGASKRLPFPKVEVGVPKLLGRMKADQAKRLARAAQNVVRTKCLAQSMSRDPEKDARGTLTVKVQATSDKAPAKVSVTQEGLDADTVTCAEAALKMWAPVVTAGGFEVNFEVTGTK